MAQTQWSDVTAEGSGAGQIRTSDGLDAERICATGCRVVQINTAADVVVVNKTDLLPYVDFDVQRCTDYAARSNPGPDHSGLGDGLDDWYAWLTRPGESAPFP